MLTMRRKLRGVAKQKASGLTGNGPDLCASQSDSWVEWAIVMFNIVQHTAGDAARLARRPGSLLRAQGRRRRPTEASATTGLLH